MLIDTIGSLAMYCQRCGHIHIQDVPLFNGKGSCLVKCENCGRTIAELYIRPRRGLKIRVRCGACGEYSSLHFTWHQLRRLHFQKLYCEHDRFELGYIGRWQDIAEFMDFNAAEYDSLHPGDGADYLAEQQILLEALNRVHDMAAAGELICPCGSNDITARLCGRNIVLECRECARYCVLPARTADDLRRLRPGSAMDFNWQRRPVSAT